MLTEKQKAIYLNFIEAINNKEPQLYSSHRRAWGKSYILNELGFELQALEYRVFLLTEYANSQEHFATDVFKDNYSMAGIDRTKAVVLVDEYRVSKIREIFKFCLEREIPIVGFIDYER